VEADRRILRSTKTRRRGWTPARQERFGRLIELYGWRGGEGTIDVLDIGVGHGESTVGSALLQPNQRHVAAELHLPGLGRLLDMVDQHALHNVEVFHGDALDLVEGLAPGQVAEVRVLFPDPWPKIRHHVRRLIRPDVVERLAGILPQGGVVHLATDHAEYAQWMHRVMTSAGPFIGGEVRRPAWRVDSRYSLRAAAAGRPVVDLRYELGRGCSRM